MIQNTGADFTIADVLAWARTKPAGETYNFVHASVCALGQFAREIRGYSEGEAACGLYERHLPLGLRDAANGCNKGGNTFGAFVKRLEALCPETPVTKSDWLTIDAYMNESVSV